MITGKGIQNVDQRIRDYTDNRYGAFEHEGRVYVKALRDETEVTQAYVNEVDFFADEDELFHACVWACANVEAELLIFEMMRSMIDSEQGKGEGK